MWSHEISRGRDTGKGDSEMNLIPRWSIVLSLAVFAFWQYIFHYVMPHPRHDLLPMRLLMGYSWGMAIASYVLLIGYISRDVKRRNMSAGLWMLIVLVIPGFIGAIVYFMLREPMLSKCPSCSTEVASSFHFCPECQFQMAPVCGQCYRGVQITDVYCVNCGHELAKDASPARLRTFSD
ncbi:double zinc ribbon domain-containing protein [Terriglobus saanensis]|uniref:DZANK-type domain-containing protein n=1 Tax=Terriglobus saanensis (strain ATCC BAA-1853 / DSM 23119 / SP1PR4) TaxID=401053 RepID=E8UYT5_TERSS|nr:zinc ribbon domain-containing protein [Terriglobus saanensis]ADV84301.1 hypothetical protein AciPR4_3548 [Terriglobus saanensis SP1PR4]